MKKLTRREMLRHSGMAILAGGLMGITPSCSSKDRSGQSSLKTGPKKRPFRISLNSSTIRGFNLPVEEQIDLTVEAGFDGIELWVSDVENYIKQGGTPEALAERMRSAGLTLENMIAFSTWISDDPSRREEGKRRTRESMELTARLGGKYIAAPAQGIRVIEREKLPEYAERFRQILEIGDETGVMPILELWGGGALNQLSDTAAITIGTGHPKATMLLDFYHLYRGGNSFDSLRQLNAAMLPVFHINDYPAEPVRTELNDADRIFPGDGICPFTEVIPMLYQSGFRGGFSVELFNQNYWDTMDAKTVLRTSYEKTVQVIDQCRL
ncbi:sugar phosphate isomerase/epimerase [Parabacteroides sp. OttesenSCG-928-G07]|nr:sugar phosphate isomerase/epimerase [Parabacteroides sp. OttesenSCG-928-G07]